MTAQVAPPVLSTPETHIFDDPTPPQTISRTPKLPTDELWDVYEVQRTSQEIWEGGYSRVALQFPDHMLKDSVPVFEELDKELRRLQKDKPRKIAPPTDGDGKGVNEALEKDFGGFSIDTTSARGDHTRSQDSPNGEDIRKRNPVRLYILADTSYGSCCVDEIAAEHVDADVVIHYGRSCLSPTARLPVIYVYTSHPLTLEPLVDTFESTFMKENSSVREENGELGDRRVHSGGRDQRIILMADITYHNHIAAIETRLNQLGWTNIYVPDVIHDPSSQIPNRKLSPQVKAELKEYRLFHISDPPPALLLTLSSRVKEMFIYSTTSLSSAQSVTPSKEPNRYSPKTDLSPTKAIQTNTFLTLRRRYALITSLSTCSIFGILINTLSVKNYLSTVTTLQKLITSAGKKYYTFVVGKVNAAKIANFSEIGGWVVVGCWESSLIEGNEFWRPVITPFELGIVLQGDETRVWSGEWKGDWTGLEAIESSQSAGVARDKEDSVAHRENGYDAEDLDEDSEPESAPPEFDLRTGRYISNTRPMRGNTVTSDTTISEDFHPGHGDVSHPAESSKALTRKTPSHLATINGAVSPGAEFLRNQRTWVGLGSDFNESGNEELSTNIEEGRSGVARGYTVGDDTEKT